MPLQTLTIAKKPVVLMLALFGTLTCLAQLDFTPVTPDEIEHFCNLVKTIDSTIANIDVTGYGEPNQLQCLRIRQRNSRYLVVAVGSNIKTLPLEKQKELLCAALG